MVWKGKKASKEERQGALNRALVSLLPPALHVSMYYEFGDVFPSQALSINLFHQDYIKAKKYPPSTTVEVMAEGGESAVFKHLFKSWTDREQSQGLGTTHTVGKIGSLSKAVAQPRLRNVLMSHIHDIHNQR